MDWLEPPFNMIISAPTCAGKTAYLLELLNTVYRKKFDYIILICPTFHNNESYNEKFVYEDNYFIVVIPDIDYIDETLIYIHIYTSAQ